MTTLHPPAPTPPAAPRLLSHTEVHAGLQGDEAVLIDVREPFERAAAYIPGSYAAPLSSFDAVAIREAHPTQRFIFYCKSGSRSADAATRFIRATETADVCSLAGGIDAWLAAGLRVDRHARAPKLDVMRQVQMIAGGLVLIGVLLGALVHPAFLILAGFVGGGLFFAGASGWCGMAVLLGAMPWNRVAGEPPQATCRTGRSTCAQ